MPTYVYECAKCGDEFELYQSFSEDPLKKHPGCGGKVAKVFQPVGIVLKGSGFYKNDSRSGAKRAKGGDSSKSEKTEKSEKSETTKSESTKSDNGSKSPSVGHRRLEVVDQERRQALDAGRQVHLVSPPLPRSFPLAPRRPPVALGKDLPCPDALPGRSRSGAPRWSSRWSPPRSWPATSPRSTAAPPVSDPSSTPSSPPATSPSAPCSPTPTSGTARVHRSQLPDAVVTDRDAVVGRVVAVPVVKGAFVAARQRRTPPSHRPRRRRAARACAPSASWSPTRSSRVPAPRSTCSRPTTRRRRPDRGGDTTERHRRRRHRAARRPTRRERRGPGRRHRRHAAGRSRPGPGPRRRPGQRRRHPRARTARGRRAPLASASLPVLHAIILGIVQGLSEFLPISSSGHLILVPELFGWTELTSNDSLNKTFDVALHVGTLIAVLAYFRHEVWSYVVAAWHSLRDALDHDGRRAHRVAAARHRDSRARSSARCSRA